MGMMPSVLQDFVKMKLDIGIKCTYSVNGNLQLIIMIVFLFWINVDFPFYSVVDVVILKQLFIPILDLGIFQ